MMQRSFGPPTVLGWVSLLVLVCWGGTARATLQTPAGSAQTADAPSDYVIGSEDVLGIVFWREPELSGDVTVRPDGKITLPVIGEIQAAGLEPGVLQQSITAGAKKYLTDVNVAVVVRIINSRKVFITGQVKSPGAYQMTGRLTVMQAIALAGGLLEYADDKNITILRHEGGDQARTLKFNYRDVARGRNLEQNAPLRPGDTVVVP